MKYRERYRHEKLSLFKNNSHFTAIAWPGVLWHTSKNVIGDDCPNLRIGGGSNIATSTVEYCKVLCLEHPRCTAFNFDGNAKNCVLRACSLPVVPPTSDAFPTYDGYWLSSGTTGLCPFCQSIFRNAKVPFSRRSRPGAGLGRSSIDVAFTHHYMIDNQEK